MALAEKLKAADEEIKTKRAAWEKLWKEVEDADEMPSTETITSLETGNKELEGLISKRNQMGNLMAEKVVLDKETEKLDTKSKAALEQARELATKTEKEGEESWSVKAIQALRDDNPSRVKPHNIDISIKDFTKKTVKTLFTESGATTGYPIENIRDPAMFVPDAVRPVQFINTVMQIQTMQTEDVYMEEQPITDITDAFVAEGGAYGEAAFQYIERRNPVKGVGAFVPATTWVLADEPMTENLLEMRLAEELMRILDDATLNGDGSSNKLRGILQYQNFLATPTNAVPTYAKPADESLQVTISKGIESVNGPTNDDLSTLGGGQGVADMVYVPVSVYWDLVRTQDRLGNFMVTAGLREAPVLRIGGVPIAQCQALPAGNILVMDRTFTHIRDRQSVDIYWMERVDTSGNQSKPTGQRMVVGDARLSITCRRPSTLFKITGA